MFGKENTMGKGLKAPTILAYQPQINFYYPKVVESPISHRFEVIDAEKL